MILSEYGSPENQKERKNIRPRQRQIDKSPRPAKEPSTRIGNRTEPREKPRTYLTQREKNSKSYSRSKSWTSRERNRTKSNENRRNYQPQRSENRKNYSSSKSSVSRQNNRAERSSKKICPGQSQRYLSGWEKSLVCK